MSRCTANKQITDSDMKLRVTLLVAKTVKFDNKSQTIGPAAREDQTGCVV